MPVARALLQRHSWVNVAGMLSKEDAEAREHSAAKHAARQRIDSLRERERLLTDKLAQENTRKSSLQEHKAQRATAQAERKEELAAAKAELSGMAEREAQVAAEAQDLERQVAAAEVRGNL